MGKWSPSIKNLAPPQLGGLDPLFLPTQKLYNFAYLSFPINLSLCLLILAHVGVPQAPVSKENLWLHILLSLLPGQCQLPWKHALPLLNIFLTPLLSSSPFIWLPDNRPNDFCATDRHVANPKSIPHSSCHTAFATADCFLLWVTLLPWYPYIALSWFSSCISGFSSSVSLFVESFHVANLCGMEFLRVWCRAAFSSPSTPSLGDFNHYHSFKCHT